MQSVEANSGAQKELIKKTMGKLLIAEWGNEAP